MDAYAKTFRTGFGVQKNPSEKKRKENKKYLNKPMYNHTIKKITFTSIPYNIPNYIWSRNYIELYRESIIHYITGERNRTQTKFEMPQNTCSQ